MRLRFYEIECDTCHDSSITERIGRDAEAIGRRDGWILRPSGDLCPDCQRAVDGATAAMADAPTLRAVR